MNSNKKVTLATMAADSISKDCKQVETAWKFIKFVNDKEWGVKRARVSNWMPLRTDLAKEI